MEDYFDNLRESLDGAYEVAEEARSRGFDPEKDPEIPLTEDLAARVEKLAGPEGVADAIREREDDYSREDLAFKIAEMIVNDKFGHLSDEEAAEQSIRTCLAIITEGIAAAAPIEGITHVGIKRNFDGSPYLAIYFAGPIRSAGGTAAALAVLTGDFVRRKLDLSFYQPSDREVERVVEEVNIYDEAVGLQYSPTEDEVREAYRNIPIEVTGEPTESETVTGYRDLDRVETDRVRGGAVLAIAEGVLQKAPKILKHLENLGLSGWGWLRDLGKSSSGEEEEKEYPKGDKYLEDIIAGRCVFGYPSRPGGFRLRYGRARNTGLAAAGIHPATMRILDDHISVGTQLKTERPGKATAAAPVDSIEGPTVKLMDGSVVQIDSVSKAKDLKSEVEEILSLGDILFGYGEFLENNHPLMPAGYCEEWWAQEVKKSLSEDASLDPDLSGYLEPPFRKPSPEHALKISRKLDVPLHPAYLYPFHDLSLGEISRLGEWLASGEPEFSNGILKELRVELDSEPKRFLEILGVPHRVEGDKAVIEGEALPLCECLGLIDNGTLDPDRLTTAVRERGDREPTEVIEYLAGVPIREKAPTRIGGRMGRPEKTKPRKMSPPPHVLFPIGLSGGSTRNITKASDKDTVEVEVAYCKCPKCETVTLLNSCPKCDTKTEIVRHCPDCDRPTENEECMACGTRTVFYKEREIEIKSLLNDSLGRIQESLPDTLKGVKGMTSAYKLPEPLEKGILRAKHDLYVFKDGTVRFDATDLPLTHFRPREIGISLERLRELGYEEDFNGEPLESEDQVVELKVQDVLLSDSAADYLLRSAQFVDELLQKFYELPPYYNASEKEDLVGHLVIGLAPHTSAGITGRIIGFSEANVGYAHPYFHAAKRRNCFHPDTKIWIKDEDGDWKYTKIEDFVEERLDPDNTNEDDFGTLYQEIDGDISVPAVDERGEQVLKKIEAISKHEPADRMIRVTTQSGRVIEVTPDHSMVRWNKGRIEKTEAQELTVGDKIPMPKTIDLGGEEKQLDLLKELLNIDRISNDDLIINGIGEERIKSILKGFVGEQEYLLKSASELGINRKTLHSLIQRDSIPSCLLLELMDREEVLDQLPDDIKLSVKGEGVELRRKITVDREFSSLLGYYVAGGFIRQEEDFFPQIAIYAPKPLVRKRIKDIIRNKLKIKDFKEDKCKITVPGRLLSVFFDDILDLGSSPVGKRIPDIIFNSPKSHLRKFIGSYFSIGPDVSKYRSEIVVHTVSDELKEDLIAALKSFGVFLRVRRDKWTAKTGAIADLRGERGSEYRGWTLKITSEDAGRFVERIGFDLREEDEIISDSPQQTSRGQSLLADGGASLIDEVESIDIVKPDLEDTYSLTVEDTHTLVANDIYTGQCDGDEDALMLLLDALLNFSTYYLPETRGGKMDAPLVLTPRLEPSEIDDEAHNVDVDRYYPSEFYEDALRFEDPGSITSKVNVVRDRLGSEDQYHDINFSEPHDTKSISAGPKACRYKSLGPMEEKTESQLSLARKIRAVDESDVAERLIVNHFIPDLKGNMRAFSRQKFRCPLCNMKYRRAPLSGRCTNCEGDLILTVTRGGVEKYMKVALKVAEDYSVGNYTRQRLNLVEEEIESLFESDIKQQLSLADFA